MPEVSVAEQVISRSVSYTDLDLSKALTLRQIQKRYPQFRGRGSKPINLQALRRWANPKRGLKPVGVSGPAVILPTLIVGREHMAMPQWVEWFITEIARLRDQKRQKPQIDLPRSEKQKAKATERALERLRKEGFDV